MKQSSETKSLYKKLKSRLQYNKKSAENDPTNFYNFPLILQMAIGIPILLVLIFPPLVLIDNNTEINSLLIILPIYLSVTWYIISLVFKPVFKKALDQKILDKTKIFWIFLFGFYKRF